MSDAPSTPPPQPTSQTTFVVYSGPSLDAVRSIVASQFQVKDAFLDPNGIPTFVVAAETAKEKFKHLLDQLAAEKLIAVLRGSPDALVIKILQKPSTGRPRRRINL